MKILQTVLALCAATWLTACGSDKLIGTWTYTATPDQLAPVFQSRTETLTFKSDLSFIARDVFVYGASATSPGPGCTSTYDFTGTYNESLTAGVEGFEETIQVATIAITQCADASQNRASARLTQVDYDVLGGSFEYSIAGKVLTLTRDLAGGTHADALPYVKQ